MTSVKTSGEYSALFLFRPYIIFVLFIILGAGIYYNSFDNPFHYDDYANIVTNLTIRNPENIPRFFIDPKLSTYDPKDAGHYRPIVLTSLAVNYAIGGLNPVGYHVVNLLFHAGSAFLIFLIVKAIYPPFLKGGWVDSGFLPALAAGLIFLVHPFNSEAVNYIIARSSLMSGFFYLLGFYFWVKYRGHGAQPSTFNVQPSTYFYIASLLAFTAGMLSKEVVITLPIVLWLYDLYFFKDIPHFLKWRTYIPYIPFVLIVVIPYMLVRLFSLGKLVGPFQRDIITQLLTEIPVLVKHWQMFFLPKGFSIVHDVAIYSGVTGRLIYSIILLTIYIGIAVYLFMRRNTVSRMVSFFMFWFLIVLLPTTIIPLNAIFQENRGYLAVVSFAVLIGIVLGELGRRRSYVLSSVFLIVIIAAGSAVTIQRNVVWGDKLGIWKDAVEKAPGAVLSYAGMATAYSQEGDDFLSFEAAKKGASIDPDNPIIIISLGTGYYLTGDIDKAIEEYKKALSIDPERGQLWNALALLYSEKGDYKRAKTCIREGIKVWKTFPPLYDTLGLIYAKEGKLEEAVGAFNSAIRLSPAFIKARYDLAETLDNAGRSAEAGDQYAKIIRLGAGGEKEQSQEFLQDENVVQEYVQKAKEKLDNRQ